MLTILGEHHWRLDHLLARVRGQRGAGGPHPAPVTDALVAVLSRHLSAEAQYLYPAVRCALPGGAALADRARATDRRLREMLREMRRAMPREMPRADPGPDGLVRGRWDQVERTLRQHIHRCERDMFPGLRRHLDQVTLIRLGNRVEIAIEAAPSRPHPRMPDVPPWNKWVDPVVGAVDKVRDALGRRVTYPEDL